MCIYVCMCEYVSIYMYVRTSIRTHICKIYVILLTCFSIKSSMDMQQPKFPWTTSRISIELLFLLPGLSTPSISTLSPGSLFGNLARPRMPFRNIDNNRRIGITISNEVRACVIKHQETI